MQLFYLQQNRPLPLHRSHPDREPAAGPVEIVMAQAQNSRGLNSGEIGGYIFLEAWSNFVDLQTRGLPYFEFSEIEGGVWQCLMFWIYNCKGTRDKTSNCSLKHQTLTWLRSSHLAFALSTFWTGWPTEMELHFLVASIFSKNLSYFESILLLFW